MIREHEDLKADVKQCLKRCVSTRCDNTADPKKRISMHRNPFFDKENAIAQKGRKMAADYVMVKRNNWLSPVQLRHCARFTSKKMT